MQIKYKSFLLVLGIKILSNCLDIEEIVGGPAVGFLKGDKKSLQSVFTTLNHS